MTNENKTTNQPVRCRNCGASIKRLDRFGWVHTYGLDVWCGYEMVTKAVPAK